MHKDKELTVAQKWYPVDRIIAICDERRARKQAPYQYAIEEYIDKTFNKAVDCKPVDVVE